MAAGCNSFFAGMAPFRRHRGFLHSAVSAGLDGRPVTVENRPQLINPLVPLTAASCCVHKGLLRMRSNSWSLRDSAADTGYATTAPSAGRPRESVSGGAATDSLGQQSGSVSQAVLQSCLDSSPVTTLEPAIRRFMESRFRTDFDNVRIHTGPAAAALCRALSARAFTVGRDIAFGAGQYDPSTEVGRRLLAHELVHFLQQRPAARAAPVPHVVVGNPDDEYEREANWLSNQALTTGVRSAPTPDGAWVIRRAITLDERSAEVTYKIANDAKPDVHISTAGFAYLHLTTGKDKILLGQVNTVVDEFDTAAITLNGSVDVRLGNGDTLDNWKIGFIQLAHIDVDQRRYAGQTRPEGSVLLDLAVKPAWDMKYELDSNARAIPLLGMPHANTIDDQRDGSKTVDAVATDHPWVRVELQVTNPATGKENYLYDCNRVLQFVAALVAPPENGKYRILGHVYWQVTWRASFNWLCGACYKAMDQNLSGLYAKVGKGAPTNSTWKSKIEMPTRDVDKIAVVLFEKCYKRVMQELTSASSQKARKELYGPNVYAADSWTDDVPEGFYWDKGCIKR
jgi:hypothetical protein